MVYELSAPDYTIDWEQFAQLISPRTRMIIINTPHNPTGRIFTEQDMLQLQRLTENSNILILSDEVYEHLTFDQQPHQSILRYPDLFERSLATYSFGITFHSTGWKMGYCIAPQNLMAEFRKVHQFNVFSVNTPVQYAIAEFLKDPSVYLSLPAFYQEKRDYFAPMLEASRFAPLACEGTYFLTADYSAISDEADKAFAKRLTKEYILAVIPNSAFYSSGKDEKVVRFCFDKTPDVLEQAGEILATV